MGVRGVGRSEREEYRSEEVGAIRGEMRGTGKCRLQRNEPGSGEITGVREADRKRGDG
ncbi:hypothetical protein CEB3_c10870 [Peptococcaceae bacterium CEB3]|nr:hypothetical protein CEB3_c10870 [Peptococcaceae bacterium CEB3]